MASVDLISENSIELNSNEQKTSLELVYSLLDTRRDLLYDLFDTVREWEFEKLTENTKKNPKEVGVECFEELINRILVSEPKLQVFDTSELLVSLLAVEKNPPTPLPCPFEDVLLERYDDNVTLKNHDKLSLIFSYLDVDSLIALSLSSKKCFYAVKVHMNKELYNLPFNKEPICTNLTCWKQTIDFFFKFAGTLKPINRIGYQPLTKLINTAKSLFPITPDSMKSHTYITFDSILPHYIVYCNHEKPMSHTCSSSNALDCENKATTKLITSSDFISEYMQRLVVKDDQLVLGFNSESVSPKYICFLLKCYLDTITYCISKHDGQIEYRKTEFTSNAKHSIIHRIWIQLSLKWDFRFGPQPQNSLSVTIADHFRLDA